jgi:hypothetical protein
MKTLVVYESLWGNTAAVARAIAEGAGPEARALTTDEATPDVIAEAELIVAGAPVIAFGLPSERMLGSLATSQRDAPTPPDLSHPSMRSWLAALPHGRGRAAAFDTRLRWSPRGANGSIVDGLERAGYESVGTPRKFIVTGTYGPLRDGELDRARAWGAELAAGLTTSARPA